MTHITGSYRFYQYERDTDVSGVSGTGTVAYLLDLGEDGMLTLWDTSFDLGGDEPEPSRGFEHLPHMGMVEAIHTYGGKTRVLPVTEPVHQQRAEELLAPAVETLMHLAARFVRVLHGSPAAQPLGGLEDEPCA